MFEMKFLTPGNFNKSCDSHYVNETVEMFKDLVEQTCKDPYRPLTTIKTLVTSGDVSTMISYRFGDYLPWQSYCHFFF